MTKDQKVHIRTSVNNESISKHVVHDSGQFCQGPPPPYHLSGVQVAATDRASSSDQSVEPLLVPLRTAPSPADCYRGDHGRRHSLIKGPQCYHFNDKN